MRVLVRALLAVLCSSQIVLAHDGEVDGEEEGGAAAQPQALCVDRRADAFPCRNLDLLAWLPTGVFGQGALGALRRFALV
jgi:hypothetical protein